ncbi:MAG TPA: glycosyltransferase family 2 protein [Oscillatoriales cyanobacterium M59_W2019_021]|nr:glycosyltransferase family 2 protein [Oscillatoriales cyanobacterium M4454_W2019_049]HIK49462.1 glycosyltransferase family 2 protein [Oscillatoriales cyanobacterium M59_W2019_021]
MDFSIVITTYNRLALLKRAIQSALSQTVACEVVVADDCSTDGTQEYVCRLCDELHSMGDLRLVYHRNATNLGHAATLNAGVKAATGDWIKPLDDDDYLAANCIEEMQRAIALRPQAVLCSCQAAQVDNSEVEIERTPITGPGKAFYIPQEDIHYGMLLEMVPFGTPAQVAFCREAFWKSGGWDSEFDGNCDDIDSWIRIAQFGDAVFLNRCLAYRTIWSGAYNQKFSVKTRLDTNLLMKQKIYPLVDPKYRETIPTLEEVRDYLQIHWGLVALKQGKVLIGSNLLFPALFSVRGWTLLVRAIVFRHHQPLETPSAHDPNEPTELKIDAHRLTDQMTANLYLAHKIYSLVDRKYRSQCPNLEAVKGYLKLRWGWTAIVRGKPIAAFKIAAPVLFYLPAWKLAIALARTGDCPSRRGITAIRRFVLMEE